MTEYTYEVLDEEKKEIKITRSRFCDKKLFIPSEIDGYKVVEIGDDAFKSKYLRLVEIPDTVRVIGKWAFAFNFLKYIKFPNGKVIVKENAFIYSNSDYERKKFLKNRRKIKMSNCKYCGAELSPTMNCTGCGSSTGEVEVVNTPATHREYACHECGGHYFTGGYCSCGNILEEIE